MKLLLQKPFLPCVLFVIVFFPLTYIYGWKVGVTFAGLTYFFSNNSYLLNIKNTPANWRRLMADIRKDTIYYDVSGDRFFFHMPGAYRGGFMGFLFGLMAGIAEGPYIRMDNVIGASVGMTVIFFLFGGFTTHVIGRGQARRSARCQGRPQ